MIDVCKRRRIDNFIYITLKTVFLLKFIRCRVASSFRFEENRKKLALIKLETRKTSNVQEKKLSLNLLQ
jgi:hypothetical protein